MQRESDYMMMIKRLPIVSCLFMPAASCSFKTVTAEIEPRDNANEKDLDIKKIGMETIINLYKVARQKKYQAAYTLTAMSRLRPVGSKGSSPAKEHSYGSKLKVIHLNDRGTDSLQPVPSSAMNLPISQYPEC